MATPELVRAAFVGATGAAATLDADALRDAGPIKVDLSQTDPQATGEGSDTILEVENVRRHKHSP